jgi:hypothetical protein
MHLRMCMHSRLYLPLAVAPLFTVATWPGDSPHNFGRMLLQQCCFRYCSAAAATRLAARLLNGSMDAVQLEGLARVLEACDGQCW